MEADYHLYQKFLDELPQDSTLVLEGAVVKLLALALNYLGFVGAVVLTASRS